MVAYPAAKMHIQASSVRYGKRTDRLRRRRRRFRVPVE
jgi:hypothetical protein